MIFALLLYGFHPSLFPLDLYRIAYIPLVLTFCIYFLFSKNSINKTSFFLFLTYSLSFIFSLFVVLYTQSTDLTMLRMHIDYMLTTLVVANLFVYFAINNNLNVVELFIKVAAFQSIIMFSMLFFPEFQKFIIGNINVQGHVRTEGAFRFRGVGLTGLATYSMAVVQCFALSLFAIYWSQEIKPSKFLISLFYFVIILLSCILSARTSFVFIIPIFIVYFFLSFFHSSKKLKNRLRAMFVAVVTVLLVTLLYLMSSSSEEFVKLYSWAFELFVAFFSEDKFSTDSTDALKGLFFLPAEFTILIGDGYYLDGEGGYYMKTDVGYLRILLFGGLAGSILFYLPFIYLSFICVSSVKKLYGYQISSVFLCYVLFLFLVNVKGSIFFDGFIAMKFLILFSLYMKNRSDICNNTGVS